jgi:hypothetical protein
MIMKRLLLILLLGFGLQAYDTGRFDPVVFTPEKNQVTGNYNFGPDYGLEYRSFSFFDLFKHKSKSFILNVWALFKSQKVQPVQNQLPLFKNQQEEKAYISVSQAFETYVAAINQLHGETPFIKEQLLTALWPEIEDQRRQQDIANAFEKLADNHLSAVWANDINENGQCSRCTIANSKAQAYNLIRSGPQAKSCAEMVDNLLPADYEESRPCEICEGNTLQKLSKTFERPADILILQRNSSEDGVIKSDAPFHIDQTLSIKSQTSAWEYDLIAIAVHRGYTALSGHYIAYTRYNYLENNWYLCNDSYITPKKVNNFETLMKEEKDHNGTPVMFFYVKRNLSSESGLTNSVRNSFRNQPIGLSNKTSVECYLNALLQCLYASLEVRYKNAQ